jgi:signal transduction protein with GAF and PtsI domain
MTPAELQQRLDDLKAKQAKLDDAWKRTGNKQLLEFFVELIPRALDAERCSIFVLDPEANNVWVMCGTGLKERQISVPRDDSIVGQVISSGTPRVESGVDQQVGAHEWVDQQTGFVTRSVVCVPVRGVSVGETTGAIEVLNKKKLREFGADDVHLLEKLAFHVQANIESVYLRQQMLKLLIEMNKAIAAMEKKLRGT